ncbi:Transcriptional regulator WAR1 [Fusarium oxysporum f. sp. albedinis]|nr:Transcriptional regulator WAR1 [Fusarium oxysporum f. sp. albedinis]
MVFFLGVLATMNYIVDKRVRAIDNQWRTLAICIEKKKRKKKERKRIKAGVSNGFPGRVRNSIRSAPGCISFQVDPGYQLRNQLRNKIRQYFTASITSPDSQGHQLPITSKTIQIELTAMRAFYHYRHVKI